MSRTRRDFMKGMTVAAAAVTVVNAGGSERYAEAAPETASDNTENRCPFYDQPMYCESLSKDGVPLCKASQDTSYF